MIRENIIKSINETLKELSHKAYMWKKITSNNYNKLQIYMLNSYFFMLLNVTLL